MQAQLIFDLPEDQEAFTLASRAFDLHCVLFNFDQWLRARLKYETLSEEEDKAYADIRGRLAEFMADYNVSMDMVS